MSELLAFGLKRCKSYPGIFHVQNPEILVDAQYIDHLIVTEQAEYVKELRLHLQLVFLAENLGALSYNKFGR